jgi:hypothetical protein
MDTNKFAKYISGGAILLAILHIFSPGLGIDATLISLLILAALPRIIPFLKTIELPGGVKIEFKDVKAATDKIFEYEGNIETTLKPESLYSMTKTSSLTLAKEDPFLVLRHVAEIDPNLGLVGFRVEIEKRLLVLAEKNNLDTYRKPLSNIVRMLQDRNIIPIHEASGLMELVGLGNRAAHGASVSPDAANWVLDVGPSILSSLDKLIEHTENDRK